MRRKAAILVTLALLLSTAPGIGFAQEQAANQEQLKADYDAAMKAIEEPGECANKVIPGAAMLSKVAEKGYAPAQFQLGVLYHQGPQGYACMVQVPEKAYYWYTKAAEQDFPKAQYELAMLYKPETGFDKFVDRAKFVTWMTKAAEHGYPKGQYQLAKMYETGDSVDQNIEKAKYWYKKAADQGEKFSIKALKRLEH